MFHIDFIYIYLHLYHYVLSQDKISQNYMKHPYLRLPTNNANLCFLQSNMLQVASPALNFIFEISGE